MAAYTELSRKASIVLVGSFNPAIFHPSWFEKFKLLPEGEITQAIDKLQVVAQEATSFKLDWLTFDVTREKLAAVTPDIGQSLPFRDLIVGTFTLLEHTPITALGMNLEITFKVEDQELAHKVGHLFAPKEIWRKHLKNPGLRELVIQGERDDGMGGHLVIGLWPSRAENEINVSFRANDHYEWLGAGISGLEIAKEINNRWLTSIERSESVILSVIKDAIES